jgi:hypothetical protein
VQFCVDRDAYWVCDSLADHFTEEARVRARIKGRWSPYETWVWLRDERRDRLVDAALDVLREENCEMQPEYLFRQVIYNSCFETTQFKVSLAKAAYSYLGQVAGRPRVRVLDPCAGWGDRLIGALAADVVAEYIGVDPNPAVHPGYQRALQELNDGATAVTMHQAAFEDLTHEELGKFHIIFTSPPFFDFEIYAEDSLQSVARHRTLRAWFDDWLMPLARALWGLLLDGGVLALHLDDTCNGAYCKDLVRGMKQELGASLYTLIACRREDGVPKPIWVWRK